MEGGKENSGKPVRDLEDRTERFAVRARAFLRRLPVTLINEPDIRQLVRSSGSVGANYLEAQNALGKRDFTMRIKIARKEAKESAYWLRLLGLAPESDLESERAALVQESVELQRILAAIIRKMESP